MNRWIKGAGFVVALALVLWACAGAPQAPARAAAPAAPPAAPAAPPAPAKPPALAAPPALPAPAGPGAPAIPPEPPAAAAGRPGAAAGDREKKAATTTAKAAETTSRSEAAAAAEAAAASAAAASAATGRRGADFGSKPKMELDLADKAAPAPALAAPGAPGAPGAPVAPAVSAAPPRPAATAAAPAAERRAAAPAASGLKAGFADDNRQFNYFVQFLDKYAGDVEHRAIPIGERIELKVADSDGRSLPNARVRVSGGGAALAEGLTYADGTFLFFPLEHDAKLASYRAEVSSGSRTRAVVVDRRGPRTVAVTFDAPRPGFQQVPLDILFVLDTTGSMGDEIERLKTTIELINLNLSSLSSKPRVRFGMVLYKDRGDEEYATRVVPFTEDLDRFQAALAKVSADGGGDTPEDLEAALGQAIKGVSWNRDGVRLAFVITDAPTHLGDYEPSYTYVDAVHDARKLGIKFFSVGTGGLPLEGELVLRQVAQYTYGKYIFLTYGESGESEGGAPGSVSHHTGANFQTDKLETIIIRFAKEELAFLTNQPLQESDDYFQANRVADESKGDTLGKLFEMALGQLVDYSSARLASGTRAATLPLVPAPPEGGLKLDAEYFSDSLIQALSRNKTFAMVERKDLQKILAELELQLSGLGDEANAARVGKLLGAEVLLSGTVYRKGDSFELFLKLVRVETGEVLAVTKARLDAKLGLSS